MKTAEEWIRKLSIIAKTSTSPCINMDYTIKQIQLDAMKEGMRRAAKIATTRRVMDKYPAASISAMNDRTITINRAILTTAEQLTEKDL